MAATAEQRILSLPWVQGGKSGTVRMSVGTAKFLNIDLKNLIVAETSYSVGSVGVSRTMYPNGPSVTYTRPAQTITRTVTGRTGTAKTNNKLVLDAGKLGRDTVYISGDRRHFVQWLKAKASPSSGEVAVKARTGSTLLILGAEPIT